MTKQFLGTTELPYRGVLLASLVVTEVYPGCDPLEFLAGQSFSGKMPHNSPGLQGAGKLQIDRDSGVGGFFFFKAAAVRIKGNLESLKKKSRNTRCLLISIANSIFFSSFTSSLYIPMLYFLKQNS